MASAAPRTFSQKGVIPHAAVDCSESRDDTDLHCPDCNHDFDHPIFSPAEKAGKDLLRL